MPRPMQRFTHSENEPPCRYINQNDNECFCVPPSLLCSVQLCAAQEAGMVMACSMNVGSKSRARFSKFLVVRDAERRREKPRCVALNILASQVEEGSHSIHNCLAVWPPS